MANVKGRVLVNKNEPTLTSAYLYGFDVNRSELKDEHKQWLTAVLLTPAKASVPARGVAVTKVVSWHIWLMGTASRTGKWGPNVDLSKRRAAAVADHLGHELGKIPHEVSTYRSGEFIPIVKGRRNDIEDPLDRAVLISIQPVTVPLVRLPPPPPPPPRSILRPSAPVPCCYWKQERDFQQAALDAWNYTNVSGGASSAARSDKLGKSEGRNTAPDRTFFVALLTRSKARGGGWTYERAVELWETSSWTNVYMENTFLITHELRDSLASWDRIKVDCTPHDPGDLCSTSWVRYK